VAYIRKLPSGKYQATVRHPSGRRLTKTDPLQRVVKQWAGELEASFARGEIRDPRAGRITVAEWYGRWIGARGVERVTRDKLASVWRTHCAAQWGTWPMDAVTAMESQEWVRVLERKRRARHRGVTVRRGEDSPELAATTVHAAVHLMSALYVAAMRERPPLVLGNPFQGLDLPRVPPAPIDFFTHEEAEALLAALDPQWALYVEMGTWMGLRPGELSGLAGNLVDWFRGSVQVTQVMTRHGLRDYPKSRKSYRTVPMSRPDMTDDLGALLKGRDRTSLVFTRPRGGAVDDTWFRHRIWVPAVKAAGVRALPPRAMRHTAASWLVMDGVDLYRVQALLGHESYATTQRYAHLAPDAHDRIRDSWRRMSDARASTTNQASRRDQRAGLP
jgi:integrase